MFEFLFIFVFRIRQGCNLACEKSKEDKRVCQMKARSKGWRPRGISVTMGWRKKNETLIDRPGLLGKRMRILVLRCTLSLVGFSDQLVWRRKQRVWDRTVKARSCKAWQHREQLELRLTPPKVYIYDQLPGTHYVALQCAA